MKEFGSLAHFAAHLLKIEAEVALTVHHGLKKVAVEIEKTAKSQFGHYQRATGGFKAWLSLTDATQADRVRQGFTPDDPLLRSGELRDSVSHTVNGLDAVIGSDSDVMVYQELGTEKIPPRPVLGPAALKNRRKIEKVLGHATASAIASTKSLPKYDFET
jgi:HK97 gp10 family phage protein